MALQRTSVTSAQRLSKTWDILELLHDTTLNAYFLGDLVTVGGISLGGGGGGVGTITSVNGDPGPAVVLVPEEIFGLAAPGAGQNGQGLVWNNAGSVWGYATPSNNFANATLTLDALRTHSLGGFALSFLNSNMGVQIAPAIAGGSAYFRAASGSAVGVANASGIIMSFIAGDDLSINGSAGTAGHVITSQGLDTAPTWTAPINIFNGPDGTVPVTTIRTVNFFPDGGLRLQGSTTAAGLLVGMAGATTTLTLQAANSAITTGAQLKLDLTAATLEVLGGTDINLKFAAASELQLTGNPGINRQVVTSQGIGLPPIWDYPTTPPNNLSSNFTVGEEDDTLRMNTTAGNLTVSLPVLTDGKRITIYKTVLANTLTIQATGGTTLVTKTGTDATTDTLTVKSGSLTYEYDAPNTTWFLVAQGF